MPRIRFGFFAFVLLAGLVLGLAFAGQTRPAPVLLLSHGSGGAAERLGWIASRLAAAGMIVVAPNHASTTSNDSDPVRSVETAPHDLGQGEGLGKLFRSFQQSLTRGRRLFQRLA